MMQDLFFQDDGFLCLQTCSQEINCSLPILSSIIASCSSEQDISVENPLQYNPIIIAGEIWSKV